MGLNFYTAREILRARDASGLGEVATIGRLQQFLLRKQISQLDREFGVDLTACGNARFGDFADAFFTAAGASEVSAIDASGYERAGVIHDMNEPVPAELHERFDMVVDGGSIEHIFKPGEALANSMRMTRVGGHLIIWAPANNQNGHGFYQFSPEFFFSALKPETGYVIERVLLVECRYPSVSLAAPRRAVRVRNPADVQARVGALSRRPLMLLVHAIKREHLEQPFSVVPQQSDYVAQWDGSSERGSAVVRGVGRLVELGTRTTPGLTLRNHALGVLERRTFSLRNRRFFGPDD